MPVGQPKMGESWGRDLTGCGSLEKGMANHFSILALNSMKRQNDRIPKEELQILVNVNNVIDTINME